MKCRRNQLIIQLFAYIKNLDQVDKLIVDNNNKNQSIRYNRQISQNAQTHVVDIIWSMKKKSTIAIYYTPIIGQSLILLGQIKVFNFHKFPTL